MSRRKRQVEVIHFEAFLNFKYILSCFLPEVCQHIAMQSIPIESIGWITSPFKEKFGAPRQAREVEEAEGIIHFHPRFCSKEAFREIENFSHLWLLFHFHQNADKLWSPTVRPPRLGGNQRVGVYASRSPFRPNSIGMSAVKNEGLIIDSNHGLSLKVKGIDLIHNTPILDVKPYLTHTDSIPQATLGYSPEVVKKLPVLWAFAYEAEDKCLIENTLSLNPLPGYQDTERSYGISIGDKNVTFSLFKETITITLVDYLTGV